MSIKTIYVCDYCGKESKTPPKFCMGTEDFDSVLVSDFEEDEIIHFCDEKCKNAWIHEQDRRS